MDSSLRAYAPYSVLPAAREVAYGHRGAVVWLTGLSGAGKSTLAAGAERRLFERGHHVCALDGDRLRQGLNRDLNYSPDDRRENVRRVGEVASLFAEAGVIVLVALISPYCEGRATARAAAGERFHEVFVRASLSVCEARDPRGLYRRARAGVIPDFTGVSAPYEPPIAADLELNTERLSVEEAIEELVAYVEKHTRINTRPGAQSGQVFGPSPKRGT